LLLLLNGLLVSRTFQGMHTQEQRVTQAQAVLIALGQLNITLDDAQNGVANYILTDAADERQEYAQARPRLDGDLAQMGTLIAATADAGGTQYVQQQQQRLASLHHLFPVEYSAWQAMVELEDAGQRSAALQLLTAGESQSVLAAIQRLLDQLQRAAQLIVQQQMQRAAAISRDAPHMLLVLALADLALLILVLVLFWRLLVLRKRLVQERTRAESLTQVQALQEANRRMEQFLSIAGHELKTPLTSLKANLQLIARRLQHAQRPASQLQTLDTQDSSAGMMADATPLVNRALTSTDRLIRLTNDLLDLGRIQSDRLALHRQPLDLCVLLRDCVEEHQLSQPARVITLTMPAQPVVVLGDGGRLGQAITNYLTNALKFSHEHQPVHVRLSVQDQQARVSVQDFGLGLPAEEQAHIWERFYRAPGVEHLSGSSEGLGIGLYITRTIIERHDGQVGVESMPGQGATFWFTLPLMLDHSLP